MLAQQILKEKQEEIEELKIKLETEKELKTKVEELKFIVKQNEGIVVYSECCKFMSS